MLTIGVCARRALCRFARPFAKPGPQCSNVAAGLPLTCARNHRRRRSPRPRTGPAHTMRARDRAPRRNASRTCRGWRSRYRQASAVCRRGLSGRCSIRGSFRGKCFSEEIARGWGRLATAGQASSGVGEAVLAGVELAAELPALSSMYSVRVGKANSTPASFTRSMIRKRIASRSRELGGVVLRRRDGTSP